MTQSNREDALATLSRSTDLESELQVLADQLDVLLGANLGHLDSAAHISGDAAQMLEEQAPLVTTARANVFGAFKDLHAVHGLLENWLERLRTAIASDS